ncbi:hypothetical protein VNO77_42953 [Canavalia gladiata]|uniref:Uncharacterized protein n=1 Tax=Canavalia gladiata TaxID=3824 RepID=A0AAN9JVG7_CANGL
MERKSIEESIILISSSETETDDELVIKRRIILANSRRKKLNNSFSSFMTPPLSSIEKYKSPSTTSMEIRKQRESSEETEDDLIKKKQPSNFLGKGKEMVTKQKQGHDLIKLGFNPSLPKDLMQKTGNDAPKEKSNTRGRPVEQSTSTSKKKKREPKPVPSWMNNWIMRPNKRPSNGRVDRYYAHKVEPWITCRSLKEVERYELYGILPIRQRGKVANEKRTEKSESEWERKEEAYDKDEQLDLDHQYYRKAPKGKVLIGQ